MKENFNLDMAFIHHLLTLLKKYANKGVSSFFLSIYSCFDSFVVPDRRRRHIDNNSQFKQSAFCSPHFGHVSFPMINFEILNR